MFMCLCDKANIRQYMSNSTYLSGIGLGIILTALFDSQNDLWEQKEELRNDHFNYAPTFLQVLLHGVSLPAVGSGTKLCDGFGHVCTLLWRGSL